VTGTAKSASAEKKEPTTEPAETASKPCRAQRREGRAAKGVAARATAATSRIAPRRRASGRRSASTPPSQYPSARYASVSPMMLAQTTVDAPK
jgi:hypothetical protein